MNYRKRLFLVIGVAGMVMLALSACSATSSPSKVEPSSPGTAKRELAPDFQISLYQGEQVLGAKEVKLSQMLAQDKPVVLNFFAGLCPPCRLEMPDFQVTYNKYHDRVNFYGLDVGPFTGLGSREDGKALLKELGITYPAGTTFAAEVVRAYRITGMPTTYLITPRGEVFQKWTGILTKDKLAELLESLLALKQP